MNMTQAEMITDDLFLKFILLIFSHVCCLPSSLSDSLLEVISTGDRMKLSDTLSNSLVNIVENIWGNIRTQLNKIFKKGQDFIHLIPNCSSRVQAITQIIMGFY